MTVDQEGGTVVSPSGEAGVRIPEGAFDGPVEITVRRIADDDAPLPTTLDQFPLFYDIDASERPNLPVTVGICVVDPPDPDAPDPAIVDRLRLAHPDPEDPQQLEILPLADAPFLDCSGSASRGSRGPALALLDRLADLVLPGALRADVRSPGPLGGLAGTFSPFGAVDPGEEFDDPPRVLSVTVPDTISNSPGDTTFASFDFRDPDGDVALAVLDVVSDPDSVFAASEFSFDPGAAGVVEGTVQIFFACPAGSASCRDGTADLEVYLEDAAGNRSNRVGFSITFVDPTPGGTSSARGATAVGALRPRP